MGLGDERGDGGYRESQLPDQGIEDHYLTTAQALGISPRERREGLDVIAASASRLAASGFKPCGHSALGCYNDPGACCSDCDHSTYWRSIHGSDPTEPDT